MSTPTVSERSSAALIARFLKARGVDRVFALCGGHIMPIWMRLDAEGIRIVDVRDERAAVYMAHAEAQLTDPHHGARLPPAAGAERPGRGCAVWLGVWRSAECVRDGWQAG